jgi:hypothetical protein
MKLQCPKCISPNAWLKKTEIDLLVVCWCGYQRVLFSILADGIEPEENEFQGFDEDERGGKVEHPKLPKSGTSLFKTLAVLSVLPGASSIDITVRLNELNGYLRAPGVVVRRDQLLTVSDVSSYLTMLKAKKLVKTTESRRGVAGGSDWELTDLAQQLLEQKEKNGTGNRCNG